MRTVKELINELNKFPHNALCIAYEGEAVGIAIQDQDDKVQHGFIYCSQNAKVGNDPETEIFT